MTVRELRQQLQAVTYRLAQLEAARAKADRLYEAFLTDDSREGPTCLAIIEHGARPSAGVPLALHREGITDTWVGRASIAAELVEVQAKAAALRLRLPSAEEVSAHEQDVRDRTVVIAAQIEQLTAAVRALEEALVAAAEPAIAVASLLADVREDVAALRRVCDEWDIPAPPSPRWPGRPAVAEPLGQLFTHGFEAPSGEIFRQIRAALPPAREPAEAAVTR